ncbi:MAG: hypothetical protein ACK5P7_02720 [Bdellovibrio sp.]|jgi:hypothetical protein
MKSPLFKAILCFFVLLTAACEKKDESKNDGNPGGTDNGNLPQAGAVNWDVGTEVPPHEAGKEGDFFIHTGNGNLYRKFRDQWTVMMTMRGAVGATGLPGAMGPQGPKGETGPTGATGPAGAAGAMGPVGPQGPAGVAGASGPEGVQGLTGENGIDANRIILTHRHGQSATVWKVPKRVIAGGPSTLEVTYGTVGNGVVVLDLGPRVRCAYRGEGASSDPRFGTFDYERGRIASLEKCVDLAQISNSDILNKTDRYLKASAVDMSRGLELVIQDQVTFQVLQAGGKIPGAKVLALIPLYIYP